MLARPDTPKPDTVAVIGLGRFGGQASRALTRLGHEVLGIDNDMSVVERWADELGHVVHADSTDEVALRQLGVAHLRTVVVGIGDDLGASVLTVLTLVELGVPDIWANATTARHGQILSAVGAHHVIDPESAMGDRVAHLITSRVMDHIEFDGFAIATTRAPAETGDQTLAEAALPTRHGIMVLAVKSGLWCHHLPPARNRHPRRRPAHSRRPDRSHPTLCRRQVTPQETEPRRRRSTGCETCAILTRRQCVRSGEPLIAGPGNAT